MFVPKYAQNNDVAEIKEFIKQNSFGILISQSSQKLMATHIPLQFSQDESKLLGHISKANPQWKKFETDTQKIIRRHLSDKEHVITEEEIASIRIGMTPPAEQQENEA